MEEALKKLLESEVLDEETKTALKEAWEKKLQEVAAETEKKVETKLREEYSTKFESDKAELVESMDKFLAEQIKKEMDEFQQERQGLLDERAKLNKAVADSRKAYQAKLAEHATLLDKFIFEQLKTELKEFQKDKKGVTEDKVAVAKKLREARLAYQTEAAKRINMLEKFVVKHLTKELAEFESDKKLLAETKAKLVSESKGKLEEARTAFLKRAATLVEGTINKVLRKEISQLREDLKVARENNFGRRIFEAFGAEFMTSYLAEGTKIKSAQAEIDGLKKALNEAKEELGGKQKLLEDVQRKVALGEDRAARTKILNELLAPLTKDKQHVMEQLLEGVKTERLREQFNRYLDAVIKTDVSKTDEGHGRRTINEASESQPEQPRKVVTGDRNNKLAETAKTESSEEAWSAEIIQYRKLAGLDK